MQAIIFIGIQASGKSSFYKEKFFNSHIRISLDLLNTRNKERTFLDTCFSSQSQFVVDNTNPTKKERSVYINRAKENKYKVIGYYFKSSIKDAITRNDLRKGADKIPEIGIRSCYKKLEMPDIKEGYDELYYVEMSDNQFVIKKWEDEI